jgi:hypothetical protein
MIMLDTHIWVWWVDGSTRLTPDQIQHLRTYEAGKVRRSKVGTLYSSPTLIAHVPSPVDGDCFLGGSGTIVTNVHNLIGDSSCPSDYSGDPNLGPLADNGGGTQTRALLPGSPAIDAIPVRDCISNTDQRGEARPIVQTSSDTPCDIGAFELQ